MMGVILKRLLEALKQFHRFLKVHPPLQYVLLGVLLAILFLAPYVPIIPGNLLSNSYLASMAIYAIAALGINLLLGFSGLISLATAGFMGVGALGLVVFMNDLPLPFTDQTGVPFSVAVLLLLVLAGLLGALVGIISLRVQGIYLAITTLFVAQILHTVFTSIRSVFGGAAGISLGSLNLFGGRVVLNQGTPYRFGFDRYWLFIIIVFTLVITMIIVHNIVKSRTGRAFMAMSRSHNAAKAMGINIVKYRVMSFVIATIFATVAGIMYTVWNQHAPNNRWDLMISLTVVAVVVVGGLKSIPGTVLGAFMIYAFPRIFLSFLANFFIVGGLLIIFVILFYPNGLVYLPVDLKKGYIKLKIKLGKKKVSKHEQT